MTLRKFVAAVAALMLSLTAWPAAAALSLTFDIDITSANGGPGVPFSFLQTWTLDDTLPDGGVAAAGPSDVTGALKTASGFSPADYAGSWSLGEEVGETREPGVVFRLAELADPPGPFFYAFRLSTVGPKGADLADVLSPGRVFQVLLTGPIMGDPGEVRVPGLVQREYRGVATLVATAPAPEPATWLLMIAGFGLVGATLRTGRLVRGA